MKRPPSQASILFSPLQIHFVLPGSYNFLEVPVKSRIPVDNQGYCTEHPKYGPYILLFLDFNIKGSSVALIKSLSAVETEAKSRPFLNGSTVNFKSLVVSAG
jgi:hypothetical protein